MMTITVAAAVLAAVAVVAVVGVAGVAGVASSRHFSLPGHYLITLDSPLAWHFGDLGHSIFGEVLHKMNFSEIVKMNYKTWTFHVFRCHAGSSYSSIVFSILTHYNGDFMRFASFCCHAGFSYLLYSFCVFSSKVCAGSA